MSIPDTPGINLPELLGRIGDYTDDVILITEAEPFGLPGPRIVHVNAAFTRMTGYRPEEVIGQTPRILQGPKTSRAACDRIRNALEAWQPIRIEILNYRKDGSEFWVELSIVPVADADGWFRYWVSVQRETSERHQYDEQRRLHELILSQINEGILVADALRPDCPIEYVNAGFTRMTGFSEQDLLDRNCRVIQSPETDPSTLTVLREAIARREPVTAEALNVRKDGSTFWNLISIAPMRNAEGEVVKFIGVQRDLTDAKLREREMVAAQRLKAVGEMTGGIAHDFNNLLTSISGAAELLSLRLAADPSLHPLVEAIRGAAQRGTGQVRRLLGFSRTPLLARGPVDLSALLQQLDLLLRRSLRDDILLEIASSADARWVEAEAVQLESALLNLVLNAQDAIAGAGRIGIAVRTGRNGDRPMVEIDVSDTGCGIDAALQARIFEPFFTTKDQGRGSGLGLATTRAFVTQLGGSIAVRSTLGQGSVFTLSLPAAAGPVALATPQPDAPRPPMPARHVLLVEDDEVVRVTARAMLECLGHTVKECANADEAVEIMARDATIDVLFTDLLMPGSMGGLELAEAARRLRPLLPVILASGWADSDLPMYPADMARQQFLLKPYTLNDLALALEKALA